MPTHPLGSEAKILLSSVFGPYARDDEYGSRTVNPMELYHNQVTRVQGAFSLRMFHRSFGLMLIQSNIDAPCTLLDFPDQDRFIEEIKNNSYDVVGISAIIPNIGKVKKMCELVREYLPDAQIIIGGHIANKPELDNEINADYICKGDGISWFRQYLGEDEKAPLRHPLAYSGFGTRILGIPLPRGNTAGVLIPSVGCPMGCNFCSTSALFGGKGNHISFYETGDELFSVLCQLEERLKVKSFFVLDENFLLYKERALRLLELMEEHDKSWAFYVFSSARVIRSYSIDQLVRIGIAWMWLGLEGEGSQYSKLNGIDTRDLVKELQSHGVRVLGSTIIGLEEHTPENMHSVIDWAVSHNTDFHQFMLYTPLAGTPLYNDYQKKGTLLSEQECPDADTHGQERFNYRHPHIPAGQEKDFLMQAFTHDFEINGPSMVRIIRTALKGWKRYKNHPDERVRRRYAMETVRLKDTYAAAVWAAKSWLGSAPLTTGKDNKALQKEITAVLKDLYREYGLISRIFAPIFGKIITFTMKREEKKLAQGWTHEPAIAFEKNARAMELHRADPILSRIKIPEIEVTSCDFYNVATNVAGKLGIKVPEPE
ncbi:MAG: B12-binding domain-containing radical SAM protein [bacterium]|nr:B12-binding domain-containing radical SAM protein [bacterium]